MNLATVRAGDLVRVARPGEPVYYAEVITLGPAIVGERTAVELRRGEVWVESLHRRRGRIVTARQIEEHWRARRRRV